MASWQETYEKLKKRKKLIDEAPTYNASNQRNLSTKLINDRILNGTSIAPVTTSNNTGLKSTIGNFYTNESKEETNRVKTPLELLQEQSQKQVTERQEKSNAKAEKQETKKKEEKKKEERTWFKGGAFKDGYDFGDVTKSLVGTYTDLYQDASKGMAKVGEAVVDTGAYAVGGIAKAVGNDDLSEKMKKFIAKNIVEEHGTSEWATNLSIIGVANNILNGNAKETYNLENLKQSAKNFTEIYNIDEDRKKTTSKLQSGEVFEDKSVLGDKSDSLVQSAGQLMAAAGLQTVGIPWWVTTGVSSYGGEIEQAFNKDATYGEAGVSGLISAGAEILTEKISGGISFGGRTLDEGLKRAIAEGISNKTVSTLTRVGMDASLEGLEEVVSEVMQGIGQKLTYEDEQTWKELLASEEAVERYIESFVGGAVLGGGSSSIKAVNSMQTGRDYDTGLTDNEQSVLKSVTEQRTTELQKQKAVEERINRVIEEQEATRGTLTDEAKQEIKNRVMQEDIDYSTSKLSKKEIAKIEQEVREDLESGEIDIDTIESTLSSEKTAKIKELMDRRNQTTNEQERLQIQAEIGKLESAKATELREMLQKDNLLQNSYREANLRNERFTYETKSTDSEYKKALAEDFKKIADNTTKSHKTFEMISKIAEDKGTAYGIINNEQLKNLNYDVDGKDINGLVRKNEDGSIKVLINIDSKKAINRIVGHETTHLLEGTKEYDEFKEFAKQYATTKGEYKSRLETTEKLYKGVKNANVENEVTADIVGDYLFTDQTFINNLSVEKPTIFQKIYNEIKHLYNLATAGSSEQRQLLQLKKSFEKAYQQNVKGTEADTKYSLIGTKGAKNLAKNSNIREYKNLYNNQKAAESMFEKSNKDLESTNVETKANTGWFKTKYGDWGTLISDKDARLTKQLEPNKTYRLGDIFEHDLLYQAYPELEKLKVETYDFGENHKTAYGAYKKSLLSEKIYLNNFWVENLGDFKGTLLHEINHYIQAKEKLDKRSRGAEIGEQNRNNNLGEIISHEAKIYSEFTQKELNDIILPELAKNNPEYENIKDLVLEKNDADFRSKLEKGESKGIYDYETNEYVGANENQNRNKKTPQTAEKREVVRSDGRRLENKELDNSSFFNTENQVTDNKGRILSKQQIEKFKDSKARDENGNLLTLYHGTKADFNVFENNLAGENYDGWSYSGKGFYFTDSIEEAQEFGDYSLGDGDTQIKEVYLNITNPFDTSTTDISVLEKLSEGYDVDKHYLQRGDFLLGWFRNNGVNASEALQKNGYDGVIDYGHYMVFEPNQIKNVDNTAPTDDPDIRYSLSEDIDQDILDDINEYKLGVESAFENIKGYRFKEMMEAVGMKVPKAFDKVEAVNMDGGFSFYTGTSRQQMITVARAVEDFKDIINNQEISNMSLSNPNEQTAPSRNDVYGSDIKYQVAEAIAPLQAEIKELREQISQPTTQEAESNLTTDLVSDIQNYTKPAPLEVVGRQQREAPLVDEAPVRYNLTPEESQELDVYENIPLDLTSEEQQRITELQNEQNLTPDNEVTETKSLFETRDYSEVGKRNINAYQYDNPEVKPYFQDIAKGMLQDLKNSTKGERFITGDISQTGNGDFEYTGTKRDVPNDIAQMLDGVDGKYKLSYKDIENGLNAIIQDEGAENNVASKRIEFFIDQRLRNGYTDFFYGDEFAPNQEYLNLVSQDNRFNIEEQYNEWLNTLPKEVPNDYAPFLEMAKEINPELQELNDIKIAPVEKNTLDWIPQDPTKESSYDEPSITNPVEAYANKKVVENRQFTRQQPAKIKKSYKERVVETWDTIQSHHINRNRQIDKLSKKTKNLEIKYKGDRVNNVAGEIGGEIFRGQTNNYGERIGKPLDAPFEAARKLGIDEHFDNYLKHQSNIERHAQKKGSKDVSLQTSQEYVKAYESKYPELKKLAADVYTYNQNQLNNAVENGIISEEFKNLLIRMYGHYVPFYGKNSQTTPNTNMSIDEIKASKPIKRAKGGSDAELLGVEQAMIQQTYAWRNAIVKNDLYKEIGKTLNNNVQLGADVRTDPTSLSESLYADENGYFLNYYDKGELKTAQISSELHKELSRDLDKQIKEIVEKYSVITKPLAKISEIRGEILTTYNPGFAITNPVKDIADALLNTKNFFRYSGNVITQATIRDSIKAKNVTEYAAQFEQLTGYDINQVTKGEKGKLFLNGKELDGQAKSLYKDYSDGSMWNRFITSYGTNATRMEYTDSGIDVSKKKKGFLRGIESANNYMEVMFRYPEFKATMQKGGSFTEALYNAREVTTNFGRGGTISKAVNQHGATFYNTSIQGMDKFFRNFSGENGARGFVGSLLKATMLGIAPALLNDLWFDDEEDEDYKAIPDYIKDNYYLFRTDEGEFIRIPKGRMISVFGSAGRRTLEWARGEENAFEGFLKNAYSQVGATNPFKENILAPIRQAYLSGENGEAWYGGELIPSRLQDKPATEQYDEGIDKFSIWLGEKLGASPYKINYVIDQYSGGVGDIVLPMLTEEAKSSGSLLAPLKDKFTADSITDNKYVSEFYTKNDEMKVRANSSKATEEDLLVNQYMKSVSSEMGALYSEMREVQSDKSLSKKEKYEKAQAIKKQINALAKEGLDGYTKVNKVDNYAEVGGREFYKWTNDDGEVVWSKTKDEDLEEMNSIGLDIEEKGTYFSTRDAIYDVWDKYSDSDDTEAKNKEIGQVIIDSGLPDEAKYSLYDFSKGKYADTEKTQALKLLDLDADTFITYASQTFTADKDENGKTISGSKKEKVFDYINSMTNIDWEQRAILAKLQYNTYDEWNYEIIDYLNASPVSYEEMEFILKQMGFEVSSDGTITWE